jgi:hypothetical protein
MKLLNKTIKIFLITSFLSSCADIPANKIKLENYKNFEQKDLEKLDLSYRHDNFYGVLKDYQNFDSNFIEKYKSKGSFVKPLDKSSASACVIEVSSIKKMPLQNICIVNYVTSFVTLFTLPFYCQHIYEARANLIFYPEESEIYGNIIKPSINQAKLGEIFLDENNRPAKLLKTYELKDKVHEVWSLIWMLSWLAVEPNKYSSIQNKYLEVGRHPEVAKTETENNISEALTRSIINDAIDHLECYKNSDPKHVLKVQSDVKKYQKNYKEILDRKNQETKEWQNQ